MSKKLIYIVFLMIFCSFSFLSCEEEFMDTKRFGEEQLKKIAMLPDIQHTASGILYRVIEENESAPPTPEIPGAMRAEYYWYFLNGEKITPSVQKKYRVEEGDTIWYEDKIGVIYYSAVPAGLQEIVRKMKVGDHYEFYLPYELAFGKEGTAQSVNIDPYTAIKIDFRLFEVWPATSMSN